MTTSPITKRSAVASTVRPMGSPVGDRVATAGFVERTRVLPFLHVSSGLPLDLVMAGPGLEDLFFDRLSLRDIQGVQVLAASVAIVAASVSFDTGCVRRTLALLEEALGQSDLQPAFEHALRRARRTAR